MLNDIFRFLIFAFLCRLGKYLASYIIGFSHNQKIWEKLEGDVVVVMGATTLIGSEICRELTNRKVKLIMVSNNRIKLEKLKDELKNYVFVHYYVIDLNSTSDNYNIFSFLDEYKIGMLINATSPMEIDYSSFINRTDDRLININIKSVTNVTHRILSQMITNRSGFVLFLGYSTCDHPSPYSAVYTSTLAYLNQLAISLYYEMKQFNVSVEYIKMGCVFNKNSSNKKCMCLCSAKSAAFHALNTFGSSRCSIPTLLHMLKTCLMSFLPHSFSGNFLEWKYRHSEQEYNKNK